MIKQNEGGAPRVDQLSKRWINVKIEEFQNTKTLDNSYIRKLFYKRQKRGITLVGYSTLPVWYLTDTTITYIKEK